jgi:hypothetical protein
MKTYLTYAAINAVIAALLLLVSFFLGFQTEKIAYGQYFQYFGLLVFITILVLGAREVREANGNKGLSYGGAVFVCFMISLFAGIFGSIYNYIHFSFINPDFAQYLADFTRSQMEAAHKSSAEIDMAVGMQAKMMNPVVQLFTGILSTPLLGTVIGLVVAIFVKRAPVDDLKDAAQPPVIQG